MKARKYAIVSILMVFTILLGACASSQATPTATSAPKDKIAVVMIGPMDDNSWNEVAYNALKTLESQGAEVAYAENISTDDAARALREYAGQGFNVVVAHTFNFQDAVFQVAPEYADVDFAWPGGIDRTDTNVADYDQPFYQAAYPIGVLAAYMSKTGKIGALYGYDIPVCHSMGEAMIAGAKTVNPDAELVVTEVGDWGDVAKAKEAALAQADAGVDFWINCGEGPALGSIEAAKEKGGYVTGYVGDMSENGPDVVLVNLMWQLEPLFSQMLSDSKAGTFANKYYQYGLAEDGVGVKYNDALKSQIPAEALTAVDQTISDIKSGKVTVPFVPSAEQ
jgi:basic membrane protein A